MAERDLKLICDAIPASYGSSISTQAHNILKALSGEEVEFDIQTGGNQPTLFSAPLSQNYNRITVDLTSANSKNGQFSNDTVLKCYVGDTEVVLSGQNAYSVTAEDDGKIFRCIISRDQFNDGVSLITCVYVDYSGNTITIQVDLTNFVLDSNVIYMQSCYPQYEGFFMTRNGNLPPSQSSIRTLWFYIDGTGSVHFPAPGKMMFQYKHRVNGTIGPSDNSNFPFYTFTYAVVSPDSSSMPLIDNYINGDISFLPRYSFPSGTATSTGTTGVGNINASFTIKNSGNVSLGTWSLNATGGGAHTGTWTSTGVSAASDEWLQISGLIQFSF